MHNDLYSPREISTTPSNSSSNERRMVMPPVLRMRHHDTPLSDNTEIQAQLSLSTPSPTIPHPPMLNRFNINGLKRSDHASTRTATHHRVIPFIFKADSGAHGQSATFSQKESSHQPEQAAHQDLLRTPVNRSISYIPIQPQPKKRRPDHLYLSCNQREDLSTTLEPKPKKYQRNIFI